MEHRAGTTVHAPSPSRVAALEREAFQLLRWGLAAVALLSAVGEVVRRRDWNGYLAPEIARVSPVGGRGLMHGVAVVEVLLAVLVAARPGIGGYVFAVWLVGIIADLVLAQGFLDVVLRDVGLALCALALARLAATVVPGPARGHPRRPAAIDHAA